MAVEILPRLPAYMEYEEMYEDIFDLSELPLATNFVTVNPNYPHPSTETTPIDISEFEELKF